VNLHTYNNLHTVDLVEHLAKGHFLVLDHAEHFLVVICSCRRKLRRDRGVLALRHGGIKEASLSVSLEILKISSLLQLNIYKLTVKLTVGNF